MTKNSQQWIKALCGVTVILMAGCATSLETPATSKVAVSAAAIDNAVAAGGPEYAPIEMGLAREKMAKARKAMEDKDYELAMGLAAEAEADAKLAQSKANSSKAQKSADALQEDIRVLREEMQRSKP